MPGHSGKLASVKLSSPPRTRERDPEYDRDPAKFRAVITAILLAGVLGAGLLLIIRGLL